MGEQHNIWLLFMLVTGRANNEVRPEQGCSNFYAYENVMRL